MKPSPDEAVSFGKWQPREACKLVASHPADTMLVMQATSILGRRVSLEEAKKLFSTLDVVTRQPKAPAVQQSRFARLLSALRAAFDGISN